MTAACADLQVLLSLRAAGALVPAEEALVAAHLADCAACRAEAARDADVLGLARLPEPSEGERRAVAAVPERVVAAVRRTEARRGAGKRVVAVVAAIAAVAVMVAAPAVLRKQPPELASAQVAATWTEPDVDGLWSETDVLELESASASGADGTASDAALAALDVDEGG
ncbi:zf-HC2 domain-containing protein [Anaeromyxobacter oryzae]|uniref:Putative zinc-finger domain-containing protein n=1 Tax=Anaeromyxobacter oryzae TaxID=2918170 RepID=A0ABM7WTK4_9BACT|nr:zf-HC2 domain-containing protein [Anaeromyxobacter oryzae]BDG02798.1 hypothetical protein AMOR_17940 [Anaeromyxobacter oryzae]